MKNYLNLYLVALILAFSCSGNVCKYRIQYTTSSVDNEFTKNGLPTLCINENRNIQPEFRVYLESSNGTQTNLFTNNGFTVNNSGYDIQRNLANCVNKKTNISKIKVDTVDYERGRLYAYGHSDCPNQCVIYRLPPFLEGDNIKIAYSKKHKRLEIKIALKEEKSLFTNETLCVNCECNNY